MMLEVEGLQAGYGDSQVLFGVNFGVEAGQATALLGRNGMGKTTTVSTIMGIIPAKGGEVRFEGRRMQGLPAFRVAQAGLGLVPEGRQIFPNLTVRENLIATAVKREGPAEPWTLKRVLEVFPRLYERINSMAGLLSGGEQQMLAIGRALMTNPRLLILDEATEGLAPLVRADIWRVLDQLKAQGQSILVIDKNVKALLRLAARHYILEKGVVVWSGSASELETAVDIQHRYLGV